MKPIIFSNYTELKNHMTNEIGYKPSYGAGINHKIEMNTAVLKSVDNTEYYNDDLTDINKVKYTLYGSKGDQDENENRYNHRLLNITKHIYLYRVNYINTKKQFTIGMVNMK
jgi:hypothetical protein